MDNLDSSEANAKVDSAYSNSCSNSQSRRSRSTKSTHSGSNSSGSSGYGGKPSSSSNDQSQTPKELKKKTNIQSEAPVLESQAEEETLPADTTAEPQQDVIQTVADSPQSVHAQSEHANDDKMDIASNGSSVAKDALQVLSAHSSALHLGLGPFIDSHCFFPVTADGFWCMISLHDGVVMYTSPSVTTALGFPRDMWIGRSFIDFIHNRDRNTFASQITSGLAVPKNVKEEKSLLTLGQPGHESASMFCRIRGYRGLATAFEVKDNSIGFTPFMLKLSFKNLTDDNGETIFLVVQAVPIYSFFKVPNEVVNEVDPFVLRHSALGILEYVSPESVQFLGYLPQELTNTDAFQLYHPEDLPYLNTVYKTIVREGAAPRSNPYRMLSQNGHYVKLETEWTSFINPWSRKLEFVTGKHYTVEGPLNPDVFHAPDLDKIPKWSEEEKKKAQALRVGIVTVINEMLTKPAEAAKQLMTKRCQKLTSFMETLMAEQTRNQEDMQKDAQEPDHTYYERDSVMLGGISPHHDYNDESSNDTPLSYNQLNYNETLDRYFESYQGKQIDEFPINNSDTVSSSITDSRLSLRYPMVASGDSGEVTSSGESVPPNECFSPVLRLTESLITKHNLEMELELVKKHREPRLSCKGEREKAAKENRLKKKAHLARCNASFYPTAASVPVVEPEREQLQPHGVKRISDGSPARPKHHCSAARHLHSPQLTPPCSPFMESANMYAQYPVGVNAYTQEGHVGHVSQQMPVMAPMPGSSAGMVPMYYMPSGSGVGQQQPHPHYQPQPVHYMMVPQPVFRSPFMYAPVTPQATFPMPSTLVHQSTLHLSDTRRTIAMATTCASERSPGAKLRDRNLRLSRWAEHTSKLVPSAEAVGLCTSSALQRSIEAVPEEKVKEKLTVRAEESAERTGGEESAERTDDSSHSSFYSSSFFKTESGSAEESADNKKVTKTAPKKASGGYEPFKKIQRRKMEPPWMEKVCMTSELIYKYQLLSKNPSEVLQEDRKKILTLEQPAMVNEQLGQLYIDLQLEGVAARLTLEEGLTSSGSSGEENNTQSTSQAKVTILKKTTRKRREYSRLAMIYEEDAPFPSPPEHCPPS